MSLPFTREEFLAVFVSYHDAIGIAPLVLLALAIAAVALARGTHPWRHRVIAGVLAVLWLWSGVVYHWGFFAAINPASRLFGAVFVLQGALLLFAGAVRGQWTIDASRAPAAIVGWLLIVYALVVYPALGWLLGHGYPQGPSFGAPCPTTIFTLGMLTWVTGGVPLIAAIVPLAWALVGTSAAAALGIPEDFGLLVSAVTVMAVMVWQRRAETRPSSA